MKQVGHNLIILFFCSGTQEDISLWLDQKMSLVTSTAKDPVIPKTKLFVEVLHDALKVVTPIYSVSQYFSRLGIDYFKILSLFIEKKVRKRYI